MELIGLHHVSSLTAHAARNVDFYTRMLGLRLVKKTVNQDDPSSYHLFYGDGLASVGTEVTFFDIRNAAANRPGSQSISRVALRVPDRAALDYWRNRFDEAGIDHDPITTEMGRAVLAFRGFEDHRLALIDDHGALMPGGQPWEKSSTPPDAGIRGLASVNLTVRDAEPTARILTEVLGFRQEGSYPAPGDPSHKLHVFATGVGGPGAEVHVEERTDLPRERLGRGGVHHVAFTVPDEQALEIWRDHLTAAGLQNTGVIDRYYFQSLYFREPNHILYELATAGPGLTADEDLAHLGEKLALPPFLEPSRARIEANLQPLDTSL